MMEMEVDHHQNRAGGEENKAAQNEINNRGNVLFEPAMYAEQNEAFEDAMDDDNRSNKTNPGGAGGKIDSQAVDAAVL